MLMLDDWQHLLRKVERWVSSRDKDLGARKQLISRMRQKFGIKTREQAEELFDTLAEQERKISRIYTKERKKFDKKWKEKLDAFSD